MKRKPKKEQRIYVSRGEFDRGVLKEFRSDIEYKLMDSLRDNWKPNLNWKKPNA